MQGQRAAAEQTDSETQIIVQAAKWPGDAKIAQEVTPLRVTVNNRGGDSLRIGYDDFVLQGASRGYAALPPFQIEGSVPTDERVASMRWRSTGYWAAPYYSFYQPSAPIYDRPFHPNMRHYRTFYPAWESYEELPTDEMLAWAMPEGVVQPGGSITGYLYFERVDVDESDVQFRAHLDSAESGMEVVNVSIPFMVID